MADLMAVDREMNHLIVGNVEERSEQKSNREKSHPIHDNRHDGQAIHSVETSFATRRFLGFSLIGWGMSEVSHVHAFKHLEMYGRACSTTN